MKPEDVEKWMKSIEERFESMASASDDVAGVLSLDKARLVKENRALRAEIDRLNKEMDARIQQAVVATIREIQKDFTEVFGSAKSPRG